MTTPTVVVHHDASTLADAVAARLITGLVDVQSSRQRVHLVLTGGEISGAVLRAVAGAPARGAVEWRRVDIWWGDERFLPAGDADRNDTLARDALLDLVDLNPDRLHAMPGPDGPDGNDPEAAADRYAVALAAAAMPEDHGPVPQFDLLLLGIGADGHTASLFPEQPAVYDERAVVAVRGAPKPPPVRLTMTLPTINSAREVWVVAAGADKADAVALALSGAGPVQVPAAGVSGRQGTRWLLDEAAAARLPRGLGRPASP